MFGRNDSGKARRFVGYGERVTNFQSSLDQTPKREPNKQPTGFLFNQKKNDSVLNISSNRLNNSMFTQPFNSPKIKPREKIILPQFKKVSSDKTLHTSLNNPKPIHQEKYSGFQVSPLVRLASVDKPVFYPKERQGVMVRIAPPDRLRERLTRSFIEPRSDHTDDATLQTSVHEAACLEFLRKKRKLFSSQDNLFASVQREDQNHDASHLEEDEGQSEYPTKRRKVDLYDTLSLPMTAIRKRPALREESEDLVMSKVEDEMNVEVKKRKVATSPPKIWDSLRNPIEVSHLSMKKFLERKAQGPNISRTDSLSDIQVSHDNKDNVHNKGNSEGGQKISEGDANDHSPHEGNKSSLETPLNENASRLTNERKLGGSLSLRKRLAAPRLDSSINSETSSEQTVRQGVTWKDLNEDRKRMYSKLNSLFGEETENDSHSEEQMPKPESSFAIKSIAQSSTFSNKMPDVTKEDSSVTNVPGEKGTGLTFPATNASNNKGITTAVYQDDQIRGQNISSEKQQPASSTSEKSKNDNELIGREDENSCKPPLPASLDGSEVNKFQLGGFKSSVASSTQLSVASTPSSSMFTMATAPSSSSNAFNLPAIGNKQDLTKDTNNTPQPSSNLATATPFAFKTGGSKPFEFKNATEPKDISKLPDSTTPSFQGLIGAQQPLSFEMPRQKGDLSSGNSNSSLLTAISLDSKQPSIFSVPLMLPTSAKPLTSINFASQNQQAIQGFSFGPTVSSTSSSLPLSSTKPPSSTAFTSSNQPSIPNFSFGSQPVKSNFFGVPNSTPSDKPKSDSSIKQQPPVLGTQPTQGFSFSGMQLAPKFGAQKTQSLFRSEPTNKDASPGTAMTSLSSSFTPSSPFTSIQPSNLSLQPQPSSLNSSALQEKNPFGGIPNGNMFKSVVNSQPSSVNPFSFQTISSKPATTSSQQVSTASESKLFQFGGPSQGGSAFNFANNSAVPETKPNSQFTTNQPNKAFDFIVGSTQVSSLSVASSQVPSFNSGVTQAPSFNFGSTKSPMFGAGTAQVPSFGAGTAQAPTFGVGTGSSQVPTFGVSVETTQASLFNSGTTKAPSFNFGSSQMPSFGSTQVPKFGASTVSTQAPAFNSGTTKVSLAFGAAAGTTQTPSFISGTSQAPSFNFSSSQMPFGSGPTEVPKFGASTGSTQAPSFNSGTTQAPSFNFGSSLGSGLTQIPKFGANTSSTQASSFNFGSTQVPSFGAGPTQVPSFGAGPTQVPTFGAGSAQVPTFNASFPAVANNGAFTLGTGNASKTPTATNKPRRKLTIKR